MDDIRKLLAAGCQPGTVNCISPRQSADCFPILIDRAFIEITASRTDEPKKDPRRWHLIKLTETREIHAGGGDDAVTRYWNVTVAMARLTLSGGQKVTGPGTAPGVAILVPWPGWLRICSPAAFDTLTAPSIRNTPSA